MLENLILFAFDILYLSSIAFISIIALLFIQGLIYQLSNKKINLYKNLLIVNFYGNKKGE